MRSPINEEDFARMLQADLDTLNSLPVRSPEDRLADLVFRLETTNPVPVEPYSLRHSMARHGLMLACGFACGFGIATAIFVR